MRMIDLQSSLIKRYFSSLDRFLILRVFSTKEINKLFQSTNIGNRNEYVNLVLNACVVDFTDKVYPDILKLDNSQGVIEELYKLCVSVNPFLDINKVSLPLTGEEKSVLHLLEAKKQPQTVEHKVEEVRNRLKQEIIGQEAAINSIDRALKRSVLGLRNLKRPIGVFLFVGKTGVGKTELAKVLTESLYNSPSRLLRINCSEFSLPHEYAKLLGAPPGYIGYDEGGILSKHLINSNEGVTLFDEIEKADVNIHNLLLQIMDDGSAQDGKGRILDFSRSIIILTSNVGTREIESINKRIGFVSEDVDHEKISMITKESLKEKFRPEFLNRISDIIVFKSLTMDDCVKIVKKFLSEINEYTSRLSINLHYTDDVPGYIAGMGYNPEYGARELRRTVDEYVLHPLSEQLLDKKFSSGDKVVIRVKRGKLNFSRN